MTTVHPLLAGRWSPTLFDRTHDVDVKQVETLLEAARWAPSAGNSQPWSFLVARRGSDTHSRIVGHLAKSARPWAPSASLLIVNLSHRRVEGTDWEYSEFSLYDLGQAVAHMTFQAQSMGLYVRQFRAFDQDALSREFTVPPHWQVTTISAVGVPASTAELDHRVLNGRSRRRPLAEITWRA